MLAVGQRELGGARQVAGEHHGATCELEGTPAAFATASTISPASAPCSPPVKSRLTNSASSSVARPSTSARICFRAAPAASRRRRDRRDRLVELPDRQGRLRRGLLLEPVDGGVADADSALPRYAREKADRDRNLCESSPRRSSARIATLRERALVAVTSVEASTTSASSVMPDIFDDGAGRATSGRCQGLSPTTTVVRTTNVVRDCPWQSHLSGNERCRGLSLVLGVRLERGHCAYGGVDVGRELTIPGPSRT